MAVFDNGDFRPGEKLVITVGGDKKSVRLDNYLCARFGQLSRAKMQRIIKGQQILVNGIKAKSSRKLSAGDTIELNLPDRDLVADELPLEIIHEDESIIILNKQPGVIIHPARGNSRGTLLNGLLHHANEKSPLGQEYIPRVIHRLDQNTSGTMVFAKNEEADRYISEQFQDRTTEKIYLALVHGKLPNKSGEIEEPIGDDLQGLERQTICKNGKYALSLYDVLEEFRNISLVKITLKTGRTHQIRVHLSHIGNPIVADTLYGGSQLEYHCAETNTTCILNRVALHAWQLSFTHPDSKKRVTFATELANDIARAKRSLETSNKHKNHQHP